MLLPHNLDLSHLPQSIFLIGPMGSGKTSIGRILANLINYEFYDTDRVIEERTGADIPWIFDVEGESGFRQREMKILDELTQLPNIVLATGGGAVLQLENRKKLHDRGFVVYLRVAIEEQLKRMERDRSRPLLQVPDRFAVLTRLAAGRDPLYQETAHMMYEAEDLPVRQSASALLELLITHVNS